MEVTAISNRGICHPFAAFRIPHGAWIIMEWGIFLRKSTENWKKEVLNKICGPPRRWSFRRRRRNGKIIFGWISRK
jgi:hypothetical protein